MLTTVLAISNTRSKGRTKPTIKAVWLSVMPITDKTVASKNNDAEGMPAVPIEVSVTVNAIRK